ADDRIDHYMVQVFRSGRCLIDDSGFQGCVLPGEVCVFDSARTLDTVNEPFDLLAFVVPRIELAPYLDQPDDVHYLRIPASKPLGAMFSEHLNRMYDMAPTLDEETASSLFVPTVELLAAALNSARADGGTPTTRVARNILISRVCHYIDAYVGNPSLDAETIVRVLGISRPSLRETFDPIGGIEALIHERRMVAASRMIRSWRGAYDLSEIAIATGFDDEWGFIQAFHARFGKLPGDMRGSNFARSADGRIGNRRAQWAMWIGAA